MSSLVLVMPFLHLVNLVLFEIHNFVLQAKFSFKVPWQSTNHQQAFVGLDCSCDLVDIRCTMGSSQGYRLGLLVDHLHSRPLLRGCRFHQVIDNAQVDDMLHSAQLCVWSRLSSEVQQIFDFYDLHWQYQPSTWGKPCGSWQVCLLPM